MTPRAAYRVGPTTPRQAAALAAANARRHNAATGQRAATLAEAVRNRRHGPTPAQIAARRRNVEKAQAARRQKLAAKGASE